jgi:threonine dehydrogenase-like Zn-dependent dehydrogenase
VLVADRVPSRLELARRLGAERTVDTREHDALAAILEWTGGEGASVVFDATGAPTLIRMAVDAVASAGRVVILGISSEEVSIPVIAFTRKEVNILGSRNNAGVFAQAADLVRRNRDLARALITHRFSLEQAPEAIEYALEHPAEAEKVLIVL